MWLKNEIGFFIALEAEDGLGRFGFSWGPSPWLADGQLLAPSSCGLSSVLALGSLSYLIDLSVAVLGLCCCVGYSLVAASRTLSSCSAGASHCSSCSCCGARALGRVGSVVSAPGLQSAGSKAWGIFLDQGLNLYLLPWQADSLPLSHQGSPGFPFYDQIVSPYKNMSHVRLRATLIA